MERTLTLNEARCISTGLASNQCGRSRCQGSGSLAVNSARGPHHDASKRALNATLSAAPHDKAAARGMEAMVASMKEDPETAAKAHEKAATLHEAAATRYRMADVGGRATLRVSGHEVLRVQTGD
jgi:hypothetical protein